jgi:hypothetical protein
MAEEVRVFPGYEILDLGTRSRDTPNPEEFLDLAQNSLRRFGQTTHLLIDVHPGRKIPGRFLSGNSSMSQPGDNQVSRIK